MRKRLLSDAERAVLQEARARRWRSMAIHQGVSAAARQRLEWMIFYDTVGQRNARRTAAYFGISAKTFHKWKGRFDPQHPERLEDQSRAPRRYQEFYHEPISTWKIERVIRHFQLYPDPERAAKRAKRRQQRPKPRIHQVPNLSEMLLWHTDTIRLHWYGQTRYIFTAIEHRARLGFAHIYPRGSSRQATDFLNRLIALSEGYLPRIHSDNGSEFAGEFEKACRKLGIQHLFSRVHRPKDNPRLERFNWTLQDEWLALSEIGLDEIDEGNFDLTNWLIEYNTHRPHQALAYMTPLSYAFSQKVLPMSPASTTA